MTRILASSLLFCVISLVVPKLASAVTIQLSPVGNLGNANDSTGFGAVGYSYYIGTYDVTNSQYVEFLNAKDPNGTSPLQIYNSNMSSSPFGGIAYASGAASGSKYSVISGDGSHPVNWVTWYDTIRFANWLNNGQGNGDTETGAYTLGALGTGGVPINGDSITRNAGATVFLPTENEWYKAAYYNPGAKSYYTYPTGSNATPFASGPTATPNSANYNAAASGLTDVGAYSGTKSPYGAFDMGGNVFQWDEALISRSVRGLRGGSYDTLSVAMLSSLQEGGDPADHFSAVEYGFRVASNVPEPSTGVLAVIAYGMMWWWGKRQRRHELERLGPALDVC